METQVQTKIASTRVVGALIKLRTEWQEAAAGRSLLSIDANVALLLLDVSMAVGLSSIEQVQVLGVELTQELDEILAPRPGNNGSH